MTRGKTKSSGSPAKDGVQNLLYVANTNNPPSTARNNCLLQVQTKIKSIDEKYSNRYRCALLYFDNDFQVRIFGACF